MSGSVGTNSGRSSGSVGSAASGPTVSSSNPAIDTNATLGTQWANSSTGDFYVLTDASTDENVWTNVDNAQDSIQPWNWTDGGGTSVYKMGGQLTSTTIDKIEKVSVSSDGNSTDISNLIAIQNGWGVGGSETHGYCNGGLQGGWGGGPFLDTVQKFQFSTDGDATDVSNLTTSRANRGGHVSSTLGYGFVAGGSQGDASTAVNIIERYPYASDTNSSDVGDLLGNQSLQGCCSDTDYGYTGGGEPFTNVIERYQFAASASGSDVGNLTNTIGTAAGHSGGTDYGFISGGNTTNVIQRFAYASSSDASDWGDLTWSTNHIAGSESTSYGYSFSGYPISNVIQKFAFGSAASATDVGDLSQTSGAGASAHK